MRSVRVPLALGTAVVGIVTPYAFAGAGTHTTTVHGTFDDRGFLTGFQGLNPAPPGVPEEAVFTGNSVVSGKQMHGSVVYTLWGKPNTGGWFDFHTVERFTGYVAGCGQGSMTYDVVGTTTPNAPPDLTQKLEASWTIVPGSGTGGLAGVQSGGGQLHGVVQPTTANSGTIDGSVTCQSRHDR